MTALQPLDWLVVAAYLAAVLFIGLVVVRRQAGAEGYFLAGRQLRWPFIGASMFASNISAEHFVGLAGSGFAIGMAIGGFEWMAVYCIVPLVVLFLPFYVRNRIYTVPEFLERRFSPGVRLLFSGLMVVLSVLTKVSISLWASSIVFSDILGWPRFWVIWGVGLVTCLYTMKGGLRAVVYTDALQTAVLLLAAVVLTVLGLQAVGGWSGLQAKLPADMFSMVRPATDPDVPWPGMFIGVFILGSFYWSMDQVLVQRAFAAKSLDEGRKGAIFCAFLKLGTPFLLVLPGPRGEGASPRPRPGRPRVPEAARDADADGAPRPHRGRHRGGADGPHQRDLQLGGDARDPRLLPALPARGRRRPGRCAWGGSPSSPSSCWAPSGPRSSASSARCGSTCRRCRPT